MNKYYIGLMSGTSMDAIDVVLLQIDDDENLKVIAALTKSFPDKLLEKISSLLSGNDNASIDSLCTLHTWLGELYAEAALDLLSKSGHHHDRICAIGCHGQTLRHQPDVRHPYSLQIGNPSVIAERTGITTVADFRSRDIAAGGQGAPLVPAFHHAIFSATEQQRTIINIGGIANITLLPGAKSGGSVAGYDTGPGNCLLDRWSLSCRGINYDNHGEWAASGSVDQELLEGLIADSYFSKSGPKSTGTEYFNIDWLENTYSKVTTLAAEDVQATLAELTAYSIALSVLREGYDKSDIFICGGGVHNHYLVDRIRHHLPAAMVQSTAALGLDPDYVEATAFGWLAKCAIDKLPGNLPTVTGARHPAILGAIYPA
jgi:anhydro-N-acetylmuramic acid kinase